MTPKQARFIEEYLVDFNGTAAAIRAGYSPKTARFIASENLTKPNIQNLLKAENEKTSKKLELTKEHIIQGLLRETNLIIKQTGKNGKVIEQKSTGPSRVAAWIALGKHLGMFIDRHEIENYTNYVIEVPALEFEPPENQFFEPMKSPAINPPWIRT